MYYALKLSRRRSSEVDATVTGFPASPTFPRDLPPSSIEMTCLTVDAVSELSFLPVVPYYRILSEARAEDDQRQSAK